MPQILLLFLFYYPASLRKFSPRPHLSLLTGYLSCVLAASLASVYALREGLTLAYKSLVHPSGLTFCWLCFVSLCFLLT